MQENSLNLGVIGNSTVSALIDDQGAWVWGCLPKLDGDPVFCRLIHPTEESDACGFFAIELQNLVRIEQSYLGYSAILSTRLYDSMGGELEVIDFAPRFRQHGRMFAPMMFVRILFKKAGHPRVKIRCRPAADFALNKPKKFTGSNHIRFSQSTIDYRLTTDAPISNVVDESAFYVSHINTFILGPDETLHDNVYKTGRRFLEETKNYWRRWVKSLSIPFEWQDAVIRAAITLKLNAFEDTGAVIAAMTTSIPESENSGRNWDYRYCWLRDAYFVINALNRLGATGTLERYMQFILNLIADATESTLQPVYKLNGGNELVETELSHLLGYRRMGPVRLGNKAYLQTQHDVYGSAILGVAHAFFDTRMQEYIDEATFSRLEPLGENAWSFYARPDAGIWELRGKTHVHTFSALMCWAACDRLAKIALQLNNITKAEMWENRAKIIHSVIYQNAWNPSVDAFCATFNGDTLDASVLLMSELQFLPPHDERLQKTIKTIGRELRRGNFFMRYTHEDDFGFPRNAFIVCSFWHIQALAYIGEKKLARDLFEHLLSYRNSLGFLSEDIDPETGELWGNFPQTYSLVGIIVCAARLSKAWESAF